MTTIPTPAALEAPEILDLMQRTLEQSEELVGLVGPDDMTAPTPCPSFDVRTLVGHMLFAAERVGRVGRREEAGDGGPAVTGLSDAEWRPAFAKAASDALEAWRREGALEGDITLPFGGFPATVVAQIYIVEQATHAWDLGRAIGRADRLDEALAEEVLAVAKAIILPEYRGDEPLPFAAEVAVPAAAPAADRLAGFLGRAPAWRRSPSPEAAGEREDIVATLRKRRGFLRFALEGVTDEDARRRTTVSELTLGGIVKHLTLVERRWAHFAEIGADAFPPLGPDTYADHAAGFVMGEGETLAGLLAAYDEVAARTDELVGSLPSLETAHELPRAPWFPEGVSWSVRMTFLHIMTETAHHCGHADIVREAIDGHKTMG